MQLQSQDVGAAKALIRQEMGVGRVSGVEREMMWHRGRGYLPRIWAGSWHLVRCLLWRQ